MALTHFGTKVTRERIYAVGNGIADWLGLDSWVQVITMQHPKRVNQMKRLLKKAK